MIRTHKDLEVWKKSIDFVTEIYKLTNSFPKSELYVLTSQLRRASVSVPSNISEGAVRKSKKEFIQFLYISLSSASEVHTQLLISMNLGFIEKKEYETIIDDLNVIARMLQGLIKSINSYS